MMNNVVIKAPAVDNLSDLKKIIKSLEYTPIPYSYIDERHLCDLEECGKISTETHNAINDWKDEHGITSLKQKGYLQSVVSLLKSLGIVCSVKIEKNDLAQPIGFSGPSLDTFIEKKVDAIALTKIGHELCNLLETNNDESISMYDNLLFWRFLHSNITHNFQKLIEDSDSYKMGVSFTLKKVEMDSRTRGYFLGWINYFELVGIDSDKLIRKKVAKKIIATTILELNILTSGLYSIQKLSSNISKKLDFSNSLINFFSVFEIILQQVQLSDEEIKAIEGRESSRDEKPLPNYPKVRMLKINHEINIDVVLTNASEEQLSHVLNVGDNK